MKGGGINLTPKKTDKKKSESDTDEQDFINPTPVQTRTRSNIKDKNIEEIIQETIINVSAKEESKKRANRSTNDSLEVEKGVKHPKLNEDLTNSKESDASETRPVIGNHKHNEGSFELFESIPYHYNRTSKSIGMEIDEKSTFADISNVSGGNEEQPLSSTVKDPLLGDLSPSTQVDLLSLSVTKGKPPIQPQLSISYEKDIKAAKERDKEIKKAE